MKVRMQETDREERSTRSIILGAFTVVLLFFFSIPSIPDWWALVHLPGLQARIRETEKQLAATQDSLEKLEAKKLMSPSDEAAQDPLDARIADVTKRLDSIQAQLAHDRKTDRAANAKIAGGPMQWVKILLELGGLLGAMFHSVDAVKRLRSWLSLLKMRF